MYSKMSPDPIPLNNVVFSIQKTHTKTVTFQKSVEVKHLNITPWEKIFFQSEKSIEEQVLWFALMLVITVIITNEVSY